MTIVRWILWISVGGAALWLFQRIFGSGLPEGLITGALDTDRSSQIGERGTGIAREARVASWRTLFTSLEERDTTIPGARTEGSVFGGVAYVAPVEEVDTQSTVLTTWITLGDSCSLSDGIGYTEPVSLPSGGTSQTIAHCYRQSGRYQWVRVGEINT